MLSISFFFSPNRPLTVNNIIKYTKHPASTHCKHCVICIFFLVRPINECVFSRSHLRFCMWIDLMTCFYCVLNGKCGSQVIFATDFARLVLDITGSRGERAYSNQLLDCFLWWQCFKFKIIICSQITVHVSLIMSSKILSNLPLYSKIIAHLHSAIEDTDIYLKQHQRIIGSNVSVIDCCRTGCEKELEFSALFTLGYRSVGLESALLACGNKRFPQRTHLLRTDSDRQCA